MKQLSFVKQYLMKPRSVGAILPSSKYLANKMMEGIDFNRATCIVEFGPGTGIFTDALLSRRKKNTKLILFETNHEFCAILKEKYQNESNLYIYHASAECIEEHLLHHDIQSVDYIVSGLPFASLPSHVSTQILHETKRYLKNNGQFITFQYTLFKKKFIGKYFRNIRTKRVFRNVPPAYVLFCTP